MMISGPGIINAFLQVAVALLFLAAVCSLVALYKGCFAIRDSSSGSVRDDSLAVLKSPLSPAIAMLAIVGDASPASRARIRRLLELHYGDLDTVVVLNGLSELERVAWAEEFRLRPRPGPAPAGCTVTESIDPIRLRVLERPHASDAVCLTAALDATSAPLIGVVDEAAAFSPDALLRLVMPFLEDPKRTLATCAAAPAPPAPGWGARLRELKALRRWMGACGALAAWGALIPPRRSFLLLDRAAVAAAGGFRGGPAELILRLHRSALAGGRPYRMYFVPDSICWASLPVSIAASGAALRRDQRDIVAALWRHRALLFGCKSFNVAGVWGMLGLRCIRPALETLACLLAVVGLIAGWIQPALAGLVLVSAVGFGVLTSLAALVGREFSGVCSPRGPGELSALFITAILENLGYRQLQNLWLLVGTVAPDRTATSKANNGRV